MIIGRGPGPKNVLIETHAGKQVVTYRTYKEMKMSEKKKWQAVAGPIAFLNDGNAGGTKVRRATINTIGGNRVQCTFWPQYDNVELELGSWIFVEGPISTYETEDKDGNPVTYVNLSVQRLAVLPLTQPGPDPKGKKSVPPF